MVRDPIYRQIGEVMRTRRKTLGYKQETLAGQLGISRGALANIETGRQNILVHQLYKYAAALQLSPFDLLPPLPVKHPKPEHSELPLPGDLKEQQRIQIARVIEQVDTNQTRDKEIKRARSIKR
jgi:transcriptional regulator with XRE-family HTH domain